MSYENFTTRRSFISQSANAVKAITAGTAIAILLALFLTACGHPSQAETVIVSTFVGGEKGFADGQGNAAQFDEPSDIAIHESGNLYVADWGNNRIRKVTPEGDVSTITAGDEGYFLGLSRSCIAIDTAGNLYQVLNNRITKSTNGEISFFAGSEQGFVDGQGSTAQFYNPSCIAIDAADNLYVVDHANHSIRKITPKGEVSTLAGGKKGFADGQGRAARFNQPYGIVIDAAGNLYVTDMLNHRIRKVTSQGEVSTIAGGKEGFADGEGKTVRFNMPFGIAINAAGNLYVTDMENHRIRKIEFRRP